MRDRAVPSHRLRYRHLADRRRLGFELERLWARITRHPGWQDQPLPARRALESALDVRLCSAADDATRLERDVLTLTSRLVLLAKALRALEREEPLPSPR